MDLRHLPNEEDSCPSQCLTKGILSLTSSLEVPEGALHPAVATGETVEASGAQNGVALITGGTMHSSVKSMQDTIARWICRMKIHAQVSVFKKASRHQRLLWKYPKGRFIQQLPQVI